MAVLTHLDEPTLARALSEYEIGAVEKFVGVDRGTVNSSFSVWAGGRRFFFRLYEEQARAGALAETRMLLHFAERGAKTPAPIARRDGALVGDLFGKPCALFPFVPGDMRCQAAVTEADAACLGRELFALHRAAEGAEPRANRFGVPELESRLARIDRDAAPELRAHVPLLREKLAHYDNARPHSPLLMVHGDMFRDNVLFEGAEVSSVLDFESAGLETRTYDLAVAMLAFAFRGAFDWGVARALVAGYESAEPLLSSEKAALFPDACFGAVRFAITRITDCAMRATNPHAPSATADAPRVKDYRRFLARLAELEALGPEKFQGIVT